VRRRYDRRFIVRLFLPVSCLALFPCLAFAADPSGYDIAKKADDTQKGFVGQKFDSIMELYDASGKMTVKYKMKQFAIEGTKANGDETKSLIRFIAPPDSKGTALLTHEKEGKEETRWLYLAETRQVKQIGGGSKSASFKGSEFSYEDLTADSLDRYDYKNLGSAKVGGQDCWKIQSTPKFPGSGYTKTVAYFHKEHLYVMKTDFYDKSGALLKVGTADKFKKVQGYWRAFYSVMENVQTKRRTVMKFGNYKLKLKLSDKMFTVSQLQKN
jgi:hypothetical protein